MIQGVGAMKGGRGGSNDGGAWEEGASSDHLLEWQGRGVLVASKGLASKASHASRRRSRPLPSSEFLVDEGRKLCTQKLCAHIKTEPQI